MRQRGDNMADKSKRYQGAFGVFWQTWDVFWKKTSISGLSNAGTSNSLFRRTCWTLIFTVFFVFTCMGLQQVIEDYLSFPVTTTVTVKHQNRVILYTLNILLQS